MPRTTMGDARVLAASLEGRRVAMGRVRRLDAKALTDAARMLLRASEEIASLQRQLEGARAHAALLEKRLADRL